MGGLDNSNERNYIKKKYKIIIIQDSVPHTYRTLEYLHNLSQNQRHRERSKQIRFCGCRKLFQKSGKYKSEGRGPRNAGFLCSSFSWCVRRVYDGEIVCGNTYISCVWKYSLRVKRIEFVVHCVLINILANWEYACSDITGLEIISSNWFIDLFTLCTWILPQWQKKAQIHCIQRDNVLRSWNLKKNK